MADMEARPIPGTIGLDPVAKQQEVVNLIGENKLFDFRTYFNSPIRACHTNRKSRLARSTVKEPCSGHDP